MKDEPVGPNWAAYIKTNFVFYDHCCELCSHAAWVSQGDHLQINGQGYGAWYRMSCKSPGPDGLNASGLQTTPDLNGRPEADAWADVVEHGYHPNQYPTAKLWLSRINAQFNVGYFMEDFSYPGNER